MPALLVIWLYGEAATGTAADPVAGGLSLQLPFAVVPLVWFTAQRSKMGAHVAPRWLTVAGVVIAVVMISLNMKLLWDVAGAALRGTA